ncbi:MAG: hypothetical protein UIH27_18330 [Ruminococcus sp.]|nr:hypothetical protein [Ruminococcus sp.]
MKKWIVIMLAAVSLLCSMMTVSAETKPGDGEIISRQEDFVPQFTLSPDSSLKEHNQLFSFGSKDYALFYTETTVLALVAGYLILFKVRGIPAHEKMHGKRGK